MAEDDQAVAGDEAARPERQSFPLVRDANFVRLTVDNTAVARRGRDLSISLIAQGPDPTDQVAEVDGDRITSLVEMVWKSSFTELARVNIGLPAAMNMAMHIFEQSVGTGFMNVSAVRAALLDILGDADEAQSDATGGTED